MDCVVFFSEFLFSQRLGSGGSYRYAGPVVGLGLPLARVRPSGELGAV